MMKILVAYKTKYGSTKQYAEWIAADLKADIMPLEEVTPKVLNAYDTVVLGVYIRIGRMIGSEFIEVNWPILSQKKIVLFSVAGAPPESPQRNVWFEANVPVEIRTKIRHFPLRGRAMHLSSLDRMIVTVPRVFAMMKYVMRPTAANKAALNGFRPFDAVKRENIKPIIDFVVTNQAHTP